MHDSRVYGFTTDVALEIARGRCGGAEPFGAYGRIETSGGVTNNLLWANGTWYIPSSSGEQISVVSTSANDTDGGTGANTIHIHYLDDELVPQIETLTMNGLTPVLTIATNIRFIQCSHLATFGTLKAAAGNILFQNIALTKLYNEIGATQIRCSSSLRMVPKNKRAVVVGLVGSSISGTAAARAEISMAVSYFLDTDYTQDEMIIPIASIGAQDMGLAYTLPIPHIAPEGTLVGMKVTTDKAAIITGDWFGWLEDAE